MTNRKTLNVSVTTNPATTTLAIIVTLLDRMSDFGAKAIIRMLAAKYNMTVEG